MEFLRKNYRQGNAFRCPEHLLRFQGGCLFFEGNDVFHFRRLKNNTSNPRQIPIFSSEKCKRNMCLKFEVVRYLKPHKGCSWKYVHRIFCSKFVVIWNPYWKQYDKRLYQQSLQFGFRDSRLWKQYHGVSKCS